MVKLSKPRQGASSLGGLAPRSQRPAESELAFEVVGLPLQSAAEVRDRLCETSRSLLDASEKILEFRRAGSLCLREQMRARVVELAQLDARSRRIDTGVVVLGVELDGELECFQRASMVAALVSQGAELMRGAGALASCHQSFENGLRLPRPSEGRQYRGANLENPGGLERGPRASGQGLERRGRVSHTHSRLGEQDAERGPQRDIVGRCGGQQ